MSTYMWHFVSRSQQGDLQHPKHQPSRRYHLCPPICGISYLEVSKGTCSIRSMNRAGGIVYSLPAPSMYAGQGVPQHPKHQPSRRYHLFLPKPPHVAGPGDPQHPKHEPSRRYLLFLPHPLHFYRPWGPGTSESSTEQAVLVPFLGGGWGSRAVVEAAAEVAAASEAAALAMAQVLRRLG